MAKRNETQRLQAERSMGAQRRKETHAEPQRRGENMRHQNSAILCEIV